MKHGTVYFGMNLPIEELRDDNVRMKLIDDGVRSIEAIPGVEILDRFPIACAVGIRLTDMMVAGELRRVLEANRSGQLSILDPSQPLAQAAK